jgi:hypothetical protein
VTWQTAHGRVTGTFALSLLFLAGCRTRPPEIRIVVVTATPAPVAVMPAAEIPDLSPTPIEQTADFSFPVEKQTAPTIQPTRLEVAESGFEQRREPTPDSLHEQMKRCLVLSAENDSLGGALEGAAKVQIRARNVCNVEFAWSDIWVEVRAMPRVGSGTVGREIARLYSGVPALGEAEGRLVVVGPSDGPFYRYEASLWWAAGGGRGLE